MLQLCTTTAARPLFLLLAGLVLVGCEERPTTNTGPFRLRIVPEAPQIESGEEVQLQADIEHGSPGTVEWSISDPEVASVDGGLVRGRAPGTATVLARTDRWEGSTLIEVVEAVESVEIEADSLTLTWGDSVRLSVEVRTASGPASRSVRYTSSNDAVASVDADGVVRALGRGRATITASAGFAGVLDEVEVVVFVPPLITIQLEGFTPAGVNDQKQIVGQRAGRAVLWEDGILTDIHPAGLETSTGDVINEGGNVGGRGSFADGGHALWLRIGGTTQILHLTTPTDGSGRLTHVFVQDFNEANALVGVAWFDEGGTPTRRPFRWDGMSFRWYDVGNSTIAVNDLGTVAVGDRLYTGDSYVTIRLNPTTLPSPDYPFDQWPPSISEITNSGDLAGMNYVPGLGADGFFRSGGRDEYFRNIYWSSANDRGDLLGSTFSFGSCSGACTPVVRMDGELIYTARLFGFIATVLSGITERGYFTVAERFGSRYFLVVPTRDLVP